MRSMIRVADGPEPLARPESSGAGDIAPSRPGADTASPRTMLKDALTARSAQTYLAQAAIRS